MTSKSLTRQKVTFSFHAPEAQSVLLAGTFTNWEQSALPLKKDKNGLWKKTVSLGSGRYEYRFIVNDQWCDDPDCSVRQPNEHGSENCVCVVEGL